MATRAAGIERLGLGLAALGRPAYINVGRGELPADRSVEAMRAASWEVLDQAYAAGVRWVDVARSYGLAEEFLAGWLEARARPRTLTVSSKWGYAYVGDWRLDAPVHEVKEHSLARFTAQWAETSALLGSALSLYQVHSLTAGQPAVRGPRAAGRPRGAAGAGGLLHVRAAAGRDRAAGARAGAARRARCSRPSSRRGTCWRPSVGRALAEAHDAGAHVLVKEALANGRLAVSPPPAIAAFAARRGVGPDAVALAAVLTLPWADTVLLGPAGPEQLRSNLAALTVHGAASLPDLAVEPETYWADRAALAWS